MRKYIAVLAVLGLVTLIFAWKSPASVPIAQQKWEFTQIRLVQSMPDAVATGGESAKANQVQKELDAVAEQNKTNQANFDSSLQRLGGEGWDLVTVMSQPSIKVGTGTLYVETAFLKRATQ